MEELAALAAMAIIPALAVALADVAGFLMGLGWGHYSRKLRARRKSKEAQNV